MEQEPKATRLVAEIQRRLPNAKVFWDKPPKPTTDNSAFCILTAASLKEPDKKVSMKYANGIGDDDHFTVEQSADDFMAYLAGKL